MNEIQQDQDLHSPYQRAVTAFQTNWGAKPAFVVRAPGRVNLIGEHTDYNDGFVLPCAIDFQAVVCITQRDDGLVRIHAADFTENDEFLVNADYTPHPTQLWANYVRGVVCAMRLNGFSLKGADISVAGNVPQGAGLSSSAALEVGVAFALAHISGLDIPLSKIALLGQQAENQFVGCNCGIMDQLVSAKGEAGHALLLDCRSLETQSVAIPQDMAVLIVHSGVRRGLVESAYNERRQQCESVAKFFGVKALRDVGIGQLQMRESELDATALRRARHVITENNRTELAAIALSQGNMVLMGQLMAQSHASMRDDFEITTPHIDRLVVLLQHHIGDAGGARMTGGGFGGCVVALLPKTQVALVQQTIQTAYQTPDGTPPQQWVCLPSAGVGVAPY